MRLSIVVAMSLKSAVVLPKSKSKSYRISAEISTKLMADPYRG